MLLSERLSIAYITNPWAPVEETTGPQQVNKDDVGICASGGAPREDVHDMADGPRQDDALAGSLTRVPGSIDRNRPPRPGQSRPRDTLPVPVKKTPLWKRRRVRKSALRIQKVRGRRAVSAAGLQGTGCHRRSLFCSDTGIPHATRRQPRVGRRGGVLVGRIGGVPILVVLVPQFSLPLDQPDVERLDLGGGLAD